MQPISTRAQRAGQIKEEDVNTTVNTSSCTYLYCLSYGPLWVEAFTTHQNAIFKTAGREKKEKKKNTVVKFYTVKRETLRERKRKGVREGENEKES